MNIHFHKPNKRIICLSQSGDPRVIYWDKKFVDANEDINEYEQHELKIIPYN
jgi:hypothetical protein